MTVQEQGPGAFDPDVLARFRELEQGEAGGAGSVADRDAGESRERWEAARRRAGVTRVSELTGLDHVGIPVFQAVTPGVPLHDPVHQAGGLTADRARASVVLAAVARSSACQEVPPALLASVHDARRRGLPIVDPLETTAALEPSYDDHQEVAWAWGYDVAQGRRVLVPVELVGLVWPQAGSPVAAVLGDGGLGAGLALVDAVLAALYDVVEQDCWTMASVLGQVLVGALDTFSEHHARAVADVLRPLAVASLPPHLQRAAARFSAAGVDLQLSSVTVGVQVACVVAVAAEGGGAERSYRGLGTHLDPVEAVGLAMASVARARVAAASEGWTGPAGAALVPTWMLDGSHGGAAAPWRASREPLDLDEVGGSSAVTPRAQLRELVTRLGAAGLDRIVVVDLTPAGGTVASCRVLVPGAESWGAGRGRVGTRLTSAWNAAAARATSADGATRA